MVVDTFKGSMAMVSLVIEQLSYNLTTYECVTVADYHDTIGIESTYSDNKMGWLSLDGIKVAETDKQGIYELILPRAIRFE